MRENSFILLNLKKFLTLLLFILYPFSVFSQQTGIEIKGDVLEESSHEAIEQATIRLLNLKDSSFIKGTTTTREGHFSFQDVQSGGYFLHISYVGYTPVFQPLQLSGNVNPVNVGKIFLTDATIALEDAVVTAETPPMVIRNDTIEYNADSYKVTEGAVLEDLLKRLPGVEVSREGKITVNGKEISKILVDGKEFFSSDPKVASQNLPADMIDKVQTYEKKSENAELTGFDDGNEENVINLTVKPEKKRGWFGNALAGYGSRERYEATGMVNHFVGNNQLTVTGNLNNTNNRGMNDESGMSRGFYGGGLPATAGDIGINFNNEINSKLSLNGNIQYNQNNSDSKTSSHIENILSSDSSLFENNRTHYNTTSKGVGTSLHVEWKPDTLTTINFRPNFNFTKTGNRSETATNSFDQADNPVFKSTEKHTTEGDGTNLQSSLQVGRRLNSKGRYLNIVLNGGYNDTSNKGFNYSSTDYYQWDTGSGNEIVDQEQNETTKNRNYNLHISWTEPLSEKYSLQASYSLEHRKQKSLKYSYSHDPEKDDYSVLDSLYSQSFENMNLDQRLNVSFRSQREKFHYQVGVDIRPSYNNSRSFVGDTTLSYISRTMMNYSPSLFFTYRIDPRTSIQLNYHGQTSQPDISQLQPVKEVTNSTHITQGNPNLKTSYRNNLSFNFRKFKPETQTALMIMGYGSQTINAITSKTSYENNGSGKRITTYENINGNIYTNLHITYHAPLRNKKFTYNTSSSIGYNINNGFINDEKSKSKNIRLQEQIRFNFRSDRVDIGTDVQATYSNSRYNLQKQNNRTIWNYQAGGYITLHLPLDIKAESDFMYLGNAGYSDGYKRKESLWNASVSKSFLKNKQATFRFKIYDILNKQSNIQRTESATSITEYEYENLRSYFMVYFVYRFQIFPGLKGGNPGSPVGGSHMYVPMRMF